MTQNVRIAILACALTMGAAASAQATPISIRVGDNDGYGLGIADNAGGIVWPGPGLDGFSYDGRSAAEKTATDGSQITDNYSAIYPGEDKPGLPYGGNNFSSANVIFPFTGKLIAGVLTIDMADFQSNDPLRGSFDVFLNGLPFAPDFGRSAGDGIHKSTVRTFALDAQQLAAANVVGQVIFSISRPVKTDDYVAFDYFQLDGETIPEPGTVVLIGLGAGAILAHRRWKLSRS